MKVRASPRNGSGQSCLSSAASRKAVTASVNSCCASRVFLRLASLAVDAVQMPFAVAQRCFEVALGATLTACASASRAIRHCVS
jgi:hypothetical protein